MTSIVVSAFVITCISRSGTCAASGGASKRPLSQQELHVFPGILDGTACPDGKGFLHSSSARHTHMSLHSIPCLSVLTITPSARLTAAGMLF